MAGLGLLFSGLSGGAQGYGNEIARQNKFDDERELMKERMAMEEQKQLRIDEVTRTRNRDDKKWEQTDLAPLARQNKLDDADALAKQKPALAGYEAEAENAKMKATAPVKAQLERDATREKAIAESTTEMLSAKRKIAQAGHIESNLSKFQLEQLRDASVLQKEYQAAVDAGDEEKAAKAARKMTGGKADKKDAGDFLRAGTNMLKLIENAETPEEAKEMKETAALMFRLGGVDPSKASTTATGKSGTRPPLSSFMKQQPASPSRESSGKIKY
jgi:hypothetical protein